MNGTDTMSADTGLELVEALDELPVRLSFDVGEATLTVGELRSLAPGHIFPLGRQLEDAPVTIRANGVAFARGEFLLVDELLAVRILELPEHGPE